MTRTPHDLLRLARIAKGFETASEAARAYGWTESTYISHENGLRGIRREAAVKYAKAFGIDPSHLLGVNGPIEPVAGVPIIGATALGIWRDKRLVKASIEAPDRYVDIPNTGASMRYAIEISDESFDKHFLPGELAIFIEVPISEASSLPSNTLVIIERNRDGLTEISARVLRKNSAGATELVTASRNAALTDVLSYPSKRDGEVIRIVGRIIAKYAEL